MSKRVPSKSAVIVGLVVSVALMASAWVIVAAESDPQHDVVGRFSIESEAGGAVWAFQPSGKLILTGPGEQIAEGAWSSSAASSRKFDATLDVAVTGQELTVLGEVSPQGAGIALFIAATPPNDEDNALPWPSESRLTGQRFGFSSEATPVPSLDATECLRPSWATDGTVDWDPCGLSEGTVDASGVASPAP
ncbi:MAG: hypothetical protein ACC726_00925 [Chloroflexota bacterium]